MKACRVVLRGMAMVMGPTPPGTGVIAEATGAKVIRKVGERYEVRSGMAWTASAEMSATQTLWLLVSAM